MARILLGLLALIALCSAHSMMICANYDIASSTCKTYIRNYGPSVSSQAYRYYQSGTYGNICQYDFKSPISSYYNNGANCGNYNGGCPSPMGTLAAGQSFTAMWYARNHAVDNQKPGNVVLYLSPQITDSTTSDPAFSAFTTQICSGSYSNCPSGNGDTVPCYLTCNMPTSLASGNYTMLWYWDWTQNDGNIYTTCADIVLTSSAAGSTTTTGVASTTSSSGTASTTSGSGATSTTSGAGTTSTTGSASATSGSTSTGSANPNALCFSQCDAKCGGDANVETCSCKDGQMDTVTCTSNEGSTGATTGGSSTIECAVYLLVVCFAMLL